MDLRVPGKTFLVGEYAVLVGGDALGLATRPCFATEFSTQVDLHPESAAALYAAHHSLTPNLSLTNPYGAGGFGLSTAEFIFVWAKKNHFHRSNLKLIFEDYQNLFVNKNKAQKPSGADLVTQLLGQVTHFRNDVMQSRSCEWPFVNLNFLVVSTGLKVATHDHLQNLDRNSLSDLPALAQNVILNFNNKDEAGFLQNLKIWTDTLGAKGLLHPQVENLKIILELNKKIQFVKPCGALGADVVLIFCSPENKSAVKSSVESMGLKIQASDADLVLGPMSPEIEVTL